MAKYDVSTKEAIFDKAIELFSEEGYENVSIRTLSMEVGIKPASIYNHYPGKQAILDSIYQFYEDNMYINRLSLESAKKIVETGSAQEISEIFLSPRYGTMLIGKRMMLIAKIIYTRMFSDEKAKTIFRKQHATSIQYTCDVLQYGIDIGRIKPFDIETYAFTYVAQFVLIGFEEFTKDAYSTHESERGEAVAKAMAAALPMIDR